MTLPIIIISLGSMAVSAIQSQPTDSLGADSLGNKGGKITTLKEVVVTARESKGLSTTSIIGSEAMGHLQPTSFTDLLELLPGNISKTPSMGEANTITLRETGSVSATGAKGSSVASDYSITSLGTLFVVDDVPVNTDANLQTVAGYSSVFDPESARETTNKGVDMRAIPTDGIESVEVIRGIPSARYGNLTSGVVRIRRRNREAPFTARFKADEYSRLFSAGKGLSLGESGHILYLNADFLDSKTDPRDELLSYRRFGGSARLAMSFPLGINTLRADISADYRGTIDGAKMDPDLNFRKTDEYRSSTHGLSGGVRLSLDVNSLSWLSNVDLSLNTSWSHDRLHRKVQVAPSRIGVAPTTMEPGVHDAVFLLHEYMADYLCDGEPLSLFASVRAEGTVRSPGIANHWSAGSEWTLSKNLGRGQVYDLERPLSASWSTRPRPYNEIPALRELFFYAEDRLTLPLGTWRLDLQAGLRTSQILSLDKDRYLHGRVYLDPRLNASVHLPFISLHGLPLRLAFSGGWGLTTRLPTVDYLYPQAIYSDFVQLNYYDILDPDAHSRINLMTYIDDPTNKDLRAARNRKYEFRFDLTWGRTNLSVTYFNENLTSGYRYSSVYTPRSFLKYDASSIDPYGLSGPPSLDGLPYEERTVLSSMSKVTNGSRIHKEGVEFQLGTPRWQTLATALTVSGAWLRTTYTNSQMLYQSVSDVVGSQPVYEKYVGIYRTNDGRVNSQLNTNFMFDTQIPRWGLIFSTNIQCMWYVKTRALRDNGTPTYYISASDGIIRPYTPEAVEQDPLLKYLMKQYSEGLYRTLTVPMAMYVNLKVTKKIGKCLRVSAFVNRLLDYLPTYKSNGLIMRRSSSPYFGMEATVII